MRTLLALFAAIITTNGGVVRPKPVPSYVEDQEIQSTDEWSAVRSNDPVLASLMQYDGSPPGNILTITEPKYLAPSHGYVGNNQFPVSNIGQHYGLTYLDHHGYDNHEQSYLNDILTLKVKEAESAADARAKEASEKQAILAKWKAEEAELLRELAEKQANFDAWMIKLKEEKDKEIKYTTTEATSALTWKPNYSSKADMRTSHVNKHSENTDNGSDSLTKIVFEDIVEKKHHSYLPTAIKQEVDGNVNTNMSLQGGKISTNLVDSSKYYADVESKIDFFKAKNDLARLTPSEASAELVKPYNGPLANIHVLPSGYLADTDEVFAARQSHMRALEDAEIAAAQWQKSHAH